MKSRMDANRRRQMSSQMLIPTVIMGVIAVALVIIAYTKGGGEHIEG
jgi:hypothetical protein